MVVPCYSYMVEQILHVKVSVKLLCKECVWKIQALILCKTI